MNQIFIEAYCVPGFVLGAGYTKKNRTWLINFTYDSSPADPITGEFEFALNQGPDKHCWTLALCQGETSD